MDAVAGDRMTRATGNDTLMVEQSGFAVDRRRISIGEPHSPLWSHSIRETRQIANSKTNDRFCGLHTHQWQLIR